MDHEPKTNKMYSTIELEIQNQVATVWLNRPEVRNAINETMITELIAAFTSLGETEEARVILLRGRGTVFCSGADLNWMKGVAAYSYEQNLEESRQLANCFQIIYESPKPTIALVHGAAIGGANGILAACDFSYADNETVFAFSEVKIGLIPATIAPYILKRTGEANARDLILTGRKIHGPEAHKLGLINQSFPKTELEAAVYSTINELLTAGPESIANCKSLLTEIAAKPLAEVMSYTAEMIARARVSTEGQEGMQSFLEKRKSSWTK